LHQQSTGEDWTDVALSLSTAKPTAATTGTATATAAGATTGSSSTGLPEAAKKTIKLQTLKKDDTNTSAAHAPTNGVFTLPKPGAPAGAAVQPSFVGPAEPDSSKSSRRIVKLKPPGKGTTGTTGTTTAAAPAFGPAGTLGFSLGAQSTPNKPFGSAVGFTAQPAADGIGAGGFTFGGGTEAGGFKFAAAPAPAPAAVATAAAAATVEEVEEVVAPTTGSSNSVAVVYSIEGAATVLSGKGPQRVIVAGLLQLAAEITYHCVPGTGPAVYVKVSTACQIQLLPSLLF
jgi:Domain of unknown function (DUF4139)